MNDLPFRGVLYKLGGFMCNFKRILKYFVILYSINTSKIQSMAIAMQINSCFGNTGFCPTHSWEMLSLCHVRSMSAVSSVPSVPVFPVPSSQCPLFQCACVSAIGPKPRLSSCKIALSSIKSLLQATQPVHPLVLSIILRLSMDIQPNPIRWS